LEFCLSDQTQYRVAVLIVGFRNPEDICGCLKALSCATTEPSFDIFICENGGSESFHKLCLALADPQGPCTALSGDPGYSLISPSGRLVDIRCLALKGRTSRVWLGRATQNLGYAGGVNVWIDRLLSIPDWEGIWILNPDAKPEPGALDALVKRAIMGNKGMVGSTIVPFDGRNYVQCRGGHHWRKLITLFSTIGLKESVNAAIDLQSIEAALDCVSGASMYVTRSCLEIIGPMNEQFFLYYEDADWSMRARAHGLGYASDSIVAHKGGTTIGSAGRRADRSRLSVYLESRNRIHFVRTHWRRSLPLANFVGFLYALEYLFVGSPRNFKAALDGLFAGIRGETGLPPNSITNR
jgi:N-acetylglucosaminyl-diphospho-decaprenol L-rhamnosyltransferase